MPSISDDRHAKLKATHGGSPVSLSMNDMERKRLLTKLGLSEPQKLSLDDLYFKAGEKPFPTPGYFVVT